MTAVFPSSSEARLPACLLLLTLMRLVLRGGRIRALMGRWGAGDPGSGEFIAVSGTGTTCCGGRWRPGGRRADDGPSASVRKDTRGVLAQRRGHPRATLLLSNGWMDDVEGVSMKSRRRDGDFPYFARPVACSAASLLAPGVDRGGGRKDRDLLCTDSLGRGRRCSR